MTYEKPRISFQKFHADTFLDNTELPSANDPDFEFFEESSALNGAVSLSPDGVGGWFNG